MKQNIEIFPAGKWEKGIFVRDIDYLNKRNFKPCLSLLPYYNSFYRGEFTLVYENPSRIALLDESGIILKYFTKAKHAYKFICAFEKANPCNLKF